MTSASTTSSTLVCLCGDPAARHRSGVRAGVPVRTTCKDCGCDGFDACEALAGAEQPTTDPAAAAAPSAGPTHLDGSQLTALIAERFAPGPGGHSVDDGWVRYALASRRPASRRPRRRRRTPSLDHVSGGAT